jgi:aryl-alcohol dehydrogenase-like predicted oxidoreductase
VINSGFADLKCSVTQLALAWVATVHPYTSSVILGATKPEQLIENLGAIDVLPRLTPDIMERIEKVLDNKPTPVIGHLQPHFSPAYVY